MFKLDSRLAADTHLVCELSLCQVLLMNDSQFPWLILVPKVADVYDIIDLDEAQQIQLTQESAQVSHMLREMFEPDKLNVASLGNVVKQLHVHHVARYVSDAAWPGPIWGKLTPVPYQDAELKSLIERVRAHLST